MLNHASFPALTDCRPAYPEVVAFGVPRGTRTRLKTAAADAGVSVSELIRRAVARVVADTAAASRTNVEA